MNVLDLFSGIGGFSLGLERAGFRTTAFCEIDPYCRKVLARHWPGVPIHDDIRQLDGTRYAGTVDLVCGGYPCQPFSTAGKQLGEEDPRHLWPEMRRIIREARPRWVVAENVRGHVKLGFDTVVAQLEDDGFTVWPFIVPASAVGAAHRRDRLWILANAESTVRRAEPRGVACGQGKGGREAEGRGLQEGMRHSVKNGPPAGSTYGGKESHWQAEPGLGRMVDGVPARVDRLRALGNAVVPQIPELIGRAIVAYERELALAA